MIEWVCGKWYHVKKVRHFYEDYTWQWAEFRSIYYKVTRCI